MNAEAKQYKAEFNNWEKEYGPTIFLDYDGIDGPNMERAKAEKPVYVWTNHATCEDEMVTSGFHFFGDPPSCCWNTFGWYITKEPWSEDLDASSDDAYESYKTSFYTWCKCNKDGENDEGDPNCKKCEGEGWQTHYFD